MGGTRRWRLRTLATMVALALTAGVAVTLSTAGAAGAAGTSSGKTGPQPPGLGLGSKAALAQSTCGAKGHTNFQYKDDTNGPFCVNPWKEGADNGGATAQGSPKDDDEGRRLRPDRRARWRRSAPRGGPRARSTR